MVSWIKETQAERCTRTRAEAGATRLQAKGCRESPATPAAGTVAGNHSALGPLERAWPSAGASLSGFQPPVPACGLPQGTHAPMWPHLLRPTAVLPPPPCGIAATPWRAGALPGHGGPMPARKESAIEKGGQGLGLLQKEPWVQGEAGRANPGLPGPCRLRNPPPIGPADHVHAEGPRMEAVLPPAPILPGRP